MVPVGKVQSLEGYKYPESWGINNGRGSDIELWQRFQIWGGMCSALKRGMGVVGQRWGVIIISASGACGGWGPDKSRTPYLTSNTFNIK